MKTSSETELNQRKTAKSIYSRSVPRVDAIHLSRVFWFGLGLGRGIRVTPLMVTDCWLRGCGRKESQWVRVDDETPNS